MKHFLLILILACLFAGSSKAQLVMRNLGFEYVNTKGYASSWDSNSDKGKYMMTLDTTVAHTGKCSYYLASTKDSTDRGNAVVTSVIIGPNLSSKHVIRISAYVKTENLSDGSVVIGLQLNGVNGALKSAGSNGQAKGGTENWKKHIVEVPITLDVQSVVFGAHMTGKGKVWLDDFEITLDDVPLKNTLIQP